MNDYPAWICWDCGSEHGRVIEALEGAANGLRHCARWNILEEKKKAIITHVMTIETLLADYKAGKVDENANLHTNQVDDSANLHKGDAK